MAALRHNQGKAPLHFVRTMPKALYALARVFEQGAIKYAPGNWQKGGKPDAEYLDSADRHLTALANGEWYDADTGCSHAAHVMWNMGALIDMNHADKADLDPTFNQDAYVSKYKETSYSYTDSTGKTWVDASADWPYGRPADLGAGEHNPVRPGSVADLARPSITRYGPEPQPSVERNWDRNKNVVDL